jgi:hypothetical protein
LSQSTSGGSLPSVFSTLQYVARKGLIYLLAWRRHPPKRRRRVIFGGCVAAG